MQCAIDLSIGLLEAILTTRIFRICTFVGHLRSEDFVQCTRLSGEEIQKKNLCMKLCQLCDGNTMNARQLKSHCRQFDACFDTCKMQLNTKQNTSIKRLGVLSNIGSATSHYMFTYSLTRTHYMQSLLHTVYLHVKVFCLFLFLMAFFFLNILPLAAVFLRFRNLEVDKIHPVTYISYVFM